MQYSQKLRDVLEQIKHLMIDNDIAGAVLLTEPLDNNTAASEFWTQIDPSWSCVSIINGRTSINTKGRTKQEFVNTLMMIDHLTHGFGLLHSNFSNIKADLEKTLDITIGGSYDTTVNTGNNNLWNTNQHSGASLPADVNSTTGSCCL